MRVTFWGVRGSLAKPGPSTLRYGGNTSCVEVCSASGTTIVIDCGTGAHELGRALVAQGRAGRGTLLIGHTHWDHIQGVPFFGPLFETDAQWEIMGPKGLGSSLRDTLAGQMEYTYFPITLDQFGATIGFHDLVEGTSEIGDVRVTTRYLNHPALTLAFRLECDGASIVYACDHEPHAREAAERGGVLAGADLHHVAFLEGADLVIHDAQYTAAEYPQRIGWGHSTVEYAAAVALAAGVGTLALTHHDPLRDDAAVDEVVELARAALPPGVSPVPEIIAAREGLTLEFTSSAPARRGTETAFAAQTHISGALVERPVLVSVSDTQSNSAIVEAIRAEGVSVAAASDLASARKALADERPSLVVLEHDPPRQDAIPSVRLLRSEGPGTPIVLVADRADVRGDEAGVTDWLIRPFSSVYARTRLRAWILREACRWIRARVPEDEQERLAALQALAMLDTDPDPRFDRITRLVASSLDVPIALVTLVDGERQWFKSRVGVELRETSRDASFCAHVVDLRETMVVPDTLRDNRFADNPLVRGLPRIRAYAGAPLIIAESGRCVGTLCAMDVRPRHFGPEQIRHLEDLRDLVVRELQVRAPAAAPP